MSSESVIVHVIIHKINNICLYKQLLQRQGKFPNTYTALA